MLCTVAAFASIALASQPVLVSELLASGQPDRARNLSQINYKGVHMGWGGHYTAPAEHRSDRLNHIYTLLILVSVSYSPLVSFSSFYLLV